MYQNGREICPLGKSSRNQNSAYSLGKHTELLREILDFCGYISNIF